MSFYIMDDKLPNWTEFAQACIALLGMVAAIIGAWKLLARDKQRESEIQSLSSIAAQLKDLQLLNEKRYVSSLTPMLDIQCKRDYVLGGHYFLYFKNLNTNGQITKFLKADYKGGMVSRISNSGKEQEFAFSISPPKKGSTLTMFMTYIVDNKYEFEQELFIYYYLDELTVRSLNVVLKPSV